MSNVDVDNEEEFVHTLRPTQYMNQNQWAANHPVEKSSRGPICIFDFCWETQRQWRMTSSKCFSSFGVNFRYLRYVGPEEKMKLNLYRGYQTTVTSNSMSRQPAYITPPPKPRWVSLTNSPTIRRLGCTAYTFLCRFAYNRCSDSFINSRLSIGSLGGLGIAKLDVYARWGAQNSHCELSFLTFLTNLFCPAFPAHDCHGAFSFSFPAMPQCHVPKQPLTSRRYYSIHPGWSPKLVHHHVPGTLPLCDACPTR